MSMIKGSYNGAITYWFGYTTQVNLKSEPALNSVLLNWLTLFQMDPTIYSNLFNAVCSYSSVSGNPTPLT